MGAVLSMKQQLYIFTFKPGKKQVWLDWCAELTKRRDEVELSMQRENCFEEACFLVGDYVVGAAAWDDIPVRDESPISVEHRAKVAKCLEKIASGYEPLYEFSI